MRAEKQEVIKRLHYVEGHLKGVSKMVEEDQYCVDILRQTYAIRKAIEKLETIIQENHLHACVPEGIQSGNTDAIIKGLIQLYSLGATIKMMSSSFSGHTISERKGKEKRIRMYFFHRAIMLMSQM